MKVKCVHEEAPIHTGYFLEFGHFIFLLSLEHESKITQFQFLLHMEVRFTKAFYLLRKKNCGREDTYLQILNSYNVINWRLIQSICLNAAGVFGLWSSFTGIDQKKHYARLSKLKEGYGALTFITD